MKSLSSFILATTVLLASVSANAATFVYRKPVSGTACPATGCVTATPPAEEPATPAYDPSVVIAQARYFARVAAQGGGGPSSYPSEAAQSGAYWQISGVQNMTATKYVVITRAVNPTTGATTYSIVNVADASAATRAAAGTAYLPATFQFTGAFRTTVSLSVRPEVCTAVAASNASDVVCTNGVVTAMFVRPETPVYFPNSGLFAVFGGYNLQNAAEYQAAENGWQATGPWPM